LSGIRSPSLAPASNPAQEKTQQQRSHIFHELAVRGQTYEELLAKWDQGSEEEFSTALKKVADFDDKVQKWIIKTRYWKELDVFEHSYAEDEDRQKAIDNAIRQYDRMRLESSDPQWQKLLPKSERGKGICLSRLQAALAKPKPTLDAASPGGRDSERDDSASSAMKKNKGGEAMSRSSSQASTGKKKLSASEAQAKRLLSNSKKPKGATTAKASPKVSPAKASTKAAGTKGGRVLSKEFVSDSSSDDDEVPLSTSMPKSKAADAPVSKPAERTAPKPKAAVKTRESPAPKPKVLAAQAPDRLSPKEMEKEKERAKETEREKEKEKENEKQKQKEKETIRAQVIAKPVKPPVKRPRDSDDDDSSSSGTPLSKRVKPGQKTVPAIARPVKHRAPSDASLNGRGTSSGVSLIKARNASPLKSSPLASSPPTTASDLEQGRPSLVATREREREHDRDTIVSSASSTADSGAGDGNSRKRPAPDPASGSRAKRPRPSQDTIDKASKFKQFYARYEQLHHELAANENPDPERVTDLLDMHDRLRRMKDEIYALVDA
jgi:RNA polymerase II elongation factor ELL